MARNTIALAAAWACAWAACVLWAVGIDRPHWQADAFLAAALLSLAVIDLRTMRLPDLLTAPLILVGFADAWLWLPVALPDRVVGAVAGYAAFGAIGFAYRLVRGRDGLGLGDAKLLAAGGAWLGWQALPITVLIAAVAGLVGVTGLHLAGRSVGRATAMPFGPALALAIWLVRLYGGALAS
ncbi:MAG: A24 family peptidase [Acetobacteraceae bacterium]